jgi:hypothetical protein
MRSVTRQRTSIALIVLSLVVMVGAIIALLQLVGSGSGATKNAVSKAAATATPIKLVNWQTATTPHATMSLQFSASDPSIAYLCATDGPTSAMGALPRIYKSVDGAKSWSLLADAPALQPIAGQPATLAQCAVFVDARDPQDVFFQQTQFQAIGAGFAIKRALYRSHDGGATWSQLAELDKTNGFAALAVFGSRLVAQAIPSVYGASQCGPNPGMPQPISLIDASDDGGQTWQPIGQSVAAAGYTPRTMAVAGVALFAIADKIPSGSCQASDSDTLWRSTDGGATWTPTSLTQPSIQSISFVARADGAGYYGLAQAPSLDGTSVRALFTSDTGATWTPLPQLPTAKTPTPTFTGAVTASGDALVAVDGGGTVYRCHASAAAPRWAPYASGMSGQWQTVGSSVWSLAVSSDPNPPSQLASLPVN